VVARHRDEPPLRQQGGELSGGRAAGVPVADDDQGRHLDLPQRVRGCRHERAQHVTDRPRVGADLPDPRRHRRFLRSGLEVRAVGHRGEQAAVAARPVALRVDRVQSLAGDERAGRPGPAGEQPQHELSA